MRGARRSLRYRAAASAVLLAVLACVAELGARAVGADLPAWKLVSGEGVVLTGHPTRLWGLSPGVKQNAETTATINEEGMRGPLPERPKPAGRPRILVVGDSTWFGHGVNDDQTFGVQLAAILKERGISAEVLNGAVPGYSTEQSRAFLDEQGFALEPDLLIVGSLWSDNNVDSFRDADLLRSARAAQDNPLFASHFFRLLATQVDRLRGGTGARLVTWTKTSQFPTKGGRRVPLQRFGENLDWMAREAAERNAGFLLIGPCNRGMVIDRYPDGASWNVYFRAQEAIAAHYGLPYVTTLPAMKLAALDGGEKRLFVDVMHPSPEGQAVFARAAADALVAAGWPAQRLIAKGEPFPFQTLEDGRFSEGDPNPGSPQRNLFGDVRAAAPPEDPAGALDRAGPEDGGPGSAPPERAAGAPAGAGSAPPERAAGAPAGTGTQPRSAMSDRWTLGGTVTAGVPPFLLEARVPGGAAVASARLAAPGPFSLRLRGDLGVVELRLTDGAGASATRTVRKGESAGALRTDSAR